MTRWGAIMAVAAFMAAAPAAADQASVEAALRSPLSRPNLASTVGVASYYGAEFHGRRTANGEIFDMHGLSAAHKTWPLPCYARVTNLGNGRSVVVRVNDRGPFVRGRMVDVSERVARLLAFQGGMSRVRLDYLGKAGPAGDSDQRALLASLKTGQEPVALKPTLDEGVSVAERSPPALAYAQPVARAPAAAALEAAVRPVAAPPPADALGVAARLDADARQLEAALEAAGKNAAERAAKTISPYGELVLAPFHPLVEASSR